MKRLVILGSRGMLGSMASRFFSRDLGYEQILHDAPFHAADASQYLSSLNALAPEVVLNCIGRIPQKSATVTQLFEANSFLPLVLRHGLDPRTILVHPSTDCVFRGDAANGYRADQLPDANDDYGLSKSLAELGLRERDAVFIVRTSIIGPEPGGGGSGLMGWFLSQSSGSRIRGYANHYWNGVTTLDWCRFVHAHLLQPAPHAPARFGLHQIGLRHPVSKYALLMLLKEATGANVRIDEFYCDATVNKFLHPQIVRDDIETQIHDLVALERLAAV